MKQLEGEKYNRQEKDVRIEPGRSSPSASLQEIVRIDGDVVPEESKLIIKFMTQKSTTASDFSTNQDRVTSNERKKWEERTKK